MGSSCAVFRQRSGAPLQRWRRYGQLSRAVAQMPITLARKMREPAALATLVDALRAEGWVMVAADPVAKP